MVRLIRVGYELAESHLHCGRPDDRLDPDGIGTVTWRVFVACILRFVQRYLPKDRDAFLSLEAQFAALERRRPDLPRGRRRQPQAGQRSSNTLIWESEFPSLAEAELALARLAQDREHDDLFRQQVPYITDVQVEFDEVLEFPEV